MKTQPELNIFKKTSIKTLKALYLLNKTYIVDSTVDRFESSRYETQATMITK
jgi:hypothetical protein